MVGLAPTKDTQVRLIYSQVLLLLSHTCIRNAFDSRSYINSKLKQRTIKYKLTTLWKKQDEGREKHCREHTSRHTSPEDGDLADSRKAPSSSSVEGSLPSSPQIGTSIVKKQKERAFKLPREAARSFNSLEFCFEIWERESAPADYCLILRRFMEVSCPSLPPK